LVVVTTIVLTEDDTGVASALYYVVRATLTEAIRNSLSFSYRHLVSLRLTIFPMKPRVIRLDNGKLTGELREVDPSPRLVIVCHGYKGSRQHPTTQAISSGLARTGHNVFTLDFSPNLGGIDVSHQVDDLRLVVSNFPQYPEVYLLAASFGAMSAVIATTQLPEIKGLVTVNGFFGTGQLGKTHRRSFWLFRIMAWLDPRYRKIRAYYRHELRPSRLNVPVLVIYSQVDQIVYPVQSETFFQEIQSPKKSLVLKTARHGLTDDADIKRVIDAVNKWMSAIEKPM
jgi:pimeloyl-ACP methyl ester carboxylesterase